MKLIRKIHLWLSLPFGLVISVVCLTGASLVFEDEITRLVQHELYYVPQVGNHQLSPEGVEAIVAATLPDSVHVTGVQTNDDPSRSWRVGLSKPHRAAVMVDPYTGQILGRAQRLGFFDFSFKMHRWLMDVAKPGGKAVAAAQHSDGKATAEAERPVAERSGGHGVSPWRADVSSAAKSEHHGRAHKSDSADAPRRDAVATGNGKAEATGKGKAEAIGKGKPVGKPGAAPSVGKRVVGYSTIAFVFILISGVVLWVPMAVRNARANAAIVLRRGRFLFWRSTHVALGGYAAVFLLLMALTGLTWSFGWYRSAFVGATGMEQKLLYTLHTGAIGGLLTKTLWFVSALIGGLLPLTGYYMWLRRLLRKS